MECREAQEWMLEALDGRPTAPETDAHSAGLDHDLQADLAHHLTECESCRRFFETQRQLDVQLSRAMSAPSLNPRFRASVMQRVRRDPSQVWPDFLPDKAHVAGCLSAVALAILMLPLPAGSTLMAGLAFTLVTYVGQSVMRSLLETLEEGLYE